MGDLFPSLCFYSFFKFPTIITYILLKGGVRAFLGERAQRKPKGTQNSNNPVASTWVLKFRLGLPENDTSEADGKEEVIFFPYTLYRSTIADFSPKSLGATGSIGGACEQCPPPSMHQPILQLWVGQDNPIFSHPSLTLQSWKALDKDSHENLLPMESWTLQTGRKFQAYIWPRPGICSPRGLVATPPLVPLFLCLFNSPIRYLLSTYLLSAKSFCSLF